MNPELIELAGRINELTDEELAELESRLADEFDRIDGEGRTPDSVDALNQIVEAAEAARTESQNRIQASEEAEARAAELRARMHPAEDSAEGPEDEEAPAEDAEAPEAPAEGRVPIAASAGRQAPGQPSMGALQRAAGTRAAPTMPSGLRARGTVVASAALGDVTPGQVITDNRQLGKMFAEAVRGLQGGTGRVKVATVQINEADYPANRVLNGDAEANTAKMEAASAPKALTASGGICAPVEIDYSLLMISDTVRPLKDGLPAFLAKRGGLQFITPADLGTYAGATSVWPETTDANPGTATKAIMRIVCGSVVQALVDAIPTRLEIGNMQSLFNPEQIANATATALAAAARVAEINLLTKMAASCKQVSHGAYLGAAPDLLATIDLLAAAFRYYHRTSPDQTFTWVGPDWTKPLLRADVARQLAHSTGAGVDPLGVDDATIVSWLRARKINPIFLLDGLPAQAAVAGNVGVVPFQGFGAQTAGAATVSWPTMLRHMLFPEGSFQFLDGGRLDFGVVRDTVVDATNDYETFVETFEGIAYRGIEAIECVSTLTPNGATAGTIAPTGYTVG